MWRVINLVPRPRRKALSESLQMRRFTYPVVLLSAGLGFGLWSCSSKSSNYKVGESTDGTLMGSTGDTVTGSSSGTVAGTGPGNTVTASSGASTTSGVNSAATNTGSTNSTSAGVGGAASTTGGTDGSGGSVSTCTDIPPDDRETCATWAEWGECDSEWLLEFCHQSCGRCNDGSNDSGTGGAGNNNGNTTSVTSNDTSSSTTGVLGDDNPWGDVGGGQQGWASRYWDCCKPSCGWEGNASNPVKSCDVNDNSLGVTDARNGCEGGGTAYTCHSMAPWAYSTKVSFGYAAINGVSCGQCFHIQFTGTASRGSGEGAQRIANKSMIVMATNIGGIEQGQFDLLIPGGGVGIFNGCSGQWGVSNEELGAQYGGFLTVCSQQNGGNYEAVKSCVRERCESVFGSRNLTDLYNGCMWFVDWFEAADNPDFRYEPVDCPQELVNAAH